MWGSCRTCEVLQAQVATLQAELRDERAERRLWMDRLIEVADARAAGAVPRHEDPVHSWAQDEHGLVGFLNGREVPLDRAQAFGVHPETGEEGTWVDGEWVSKREWDRWIGRIGQEAGGVSPGTT